MSISLRIGGAWVAATRRVRIGGAWLPGEPPPAPSLSATTLFPGGAGIVESVSNEEAIIGRLAGLATPDDLGTGLFRTVVRLDNAAGVRPFVRMRSQNGGWSRTTEAINNAMAFIPDPAGDTILHADITLVDGTDSRARLPDPFASTPFHAGIQPYYFLARKAAMRAVWLANPLFVPGPDCDANGVFATATGIPDPTPGRGFNAPDMPLHCFQIGTGPIHVLVAEGNHPNEWGAGYILEGLVNFLLSSDPVAVAARANITWTIYDDVNPFARFYGVARAQPQIIGGVVRDSNRSWGIASPAQVVSLHMSHMQAYAPPLGYSVIYDLHTQGNSSDARTLGWGIYGTFSLSGGRQQLGEAFTAFLTAAGTNSNHTGQSTSNTNWLRMWAQQEMGAQGSAAYAIEISNRGFPPHFRALGERLVSAANSAVVAGFFNMNLPPPPPPPDEWVITGAEITAAPAAPAAPTVSGDQITG